VSPEGADSTPPRNGFWTRLLALLPWFVLYRFASLLGLLAWKVFPYRQHVVRENLTTAFPDLDEAGLQDLMRRYYSGFAQVLVEIVKSSRLTPDQLREHISFAGLELLRAQLEKGTPVLLAGAHQANWEWVLMGLSIELGYPVDAAYKPLVNTWGDREMLALRSRFGARMIPAQNVLTDILKRGKLPRAIAMLADQEPKNAERMHWTRFLNRDSAFYVGPEEIARATKFPVFFLGMRRKSRGQYEIEIKPLAEAKERPEPGVLTERYARMVEAQIHASPADWPWSHKRWRLRKKSLYGKS
jgi:Kdo2-lipid IVA lauroyltransferase/acyltransferase